MEYQIKNYGFVKPKISTDHYFLGSGSSLTSNVLQPNGDWTPFIPPFEGQAINFETYGCTVFGTYRALVTLMKRVYGTDNNFAERFTYILANITPPGSDPHLVAELIRKNGLLEQSILPMTETLAEFNTPKPMTAELLATGHKWLEKYGFGHDWVFTNNPTTQARVIMLKDALTKGTVCISVTAWMQDSTGLFIDNDQPNCHWVHLIRFDEINGESIPVVDDSYAMGVNNIKRLHPDHHIEFAKRYTVNTVLTEEKRNYFLDLLKKIINQIFNIQKEVALLPKPVTSQPAEVYQEVKTSLMENKIEKWAKAIAKWEGDSSGVNPGNLKYASLTKSWGATQGRKASDGGYFAKFSSYDKGFTALCDFLTLACKDQLKSYHTARTFEQFTKIYAGNPPHGYIEGIRLMVGCELNTDIKTFL